MVSVRVVLISTYEMGRQPFGLASPAAWLRRNGHQVTCADLAVGAFPADDIRQAGLLAFYLPMHTATRLAARLIPRVRLLNPAAHIACYGLYAPLNDAYLRKLGVETVIGGEFEAELAGLAAGLRRGSTLVPLERLSFVVPDRTAVPPLERYARLHVNGRQKIVGYTEASRGCKHLCRHCPVVPIYSGAFRIVQADVVIEDVRRQVEAGAAHITFGDPDFLNGPSHARHIVEEMHERFPSLTYDVTAKVEHLLRHRDLLPVMRETGCLFVTTAVESIDDEILMRLEKGHTRADFLELVGEFRHQDLTLAPTFIPFTPWTTPSGYRELLETLAALDLVENTGSVQLALRLLVPSGSRLLELDDVRRLVEGFDEETLTHRWRHPDPAVDELASRLLKLVANMQKRKASRTDIFAAIWEAASGSAFPENYRLLPRAAIPYLDEPWYC